MQVSNSEARVPALLKYTSSKLARSVTGTNISSPQTPRTHLTVDFQAPYPPLPEQASAHHPSLAQIRHTWYFLCLRANSYAAYSQLTNPVNITSRLPSGTWDACTTLTQPPVHRGTSIFLQRPTWLPPPKPPVLIPPPSSERKSDRGLGELIDSLPHQQRAAVL